MLLRRTRESPDVLSGSFFCSLSAHPIPSEEKMGRATEETGESRSKKSGRILRVTVVEEGRIVYGCSNSSSEARSVLAAKTHKAHSGSIFVYYAQLSRRTDIYCLPGTLCALYEPDTVGRDHGPAIRWSAKLCQHLPGPDFLDHDAQYPDLYRCDGASRHPAESWRGAAPQSARARSAILPHCDADPRRDFGPGDRGDLEVDL